MAQRLSPKIRRVAGGQTHFAVPEPCRLLVGMIAVFARTGFFHWPTARQRDAARRIERPKKWLREFRVDVIRSHAFTADAEFELIVLAGNGDGQIVTRSSAERTHH